MKYRARMARLVSREFKRIWIYFDGDKWSQICTNVGLISNCDGEVVNILKSIIRKH